MYIFGYGSLINRHSRLLTGHTGDALPVSVIGLQRHWGKVDGCYKISPLVAVEGEGRCNGVLVHIHETVVKQFDLREKGYRRIELDPDNLVTDVEVSRAEPIWVYVRTCPEPPCRLQPIMQSYVDTVLAGCLSISDQFAKIFVETTKGWHHPLENDRHQPKYGNCVGIAGAHLAQIDRLIARTRILNELKNNGETK